MIMHQIERDVKKSSKLTFFNKYIKNITINTLAYIMLKLRK